MLVISEITYLITSKKLPLLNNLRIKLINCNCINVPLCKVFACEVDKVIINNNKEVYSVSDCVGLELCSSVGCLLAVLF